MPDLEKVDNNKKKFLEEFESLRPDLMYEGVWSEEDRETALEELKPKRLKSSMFASIPLRCEGPKCPFSETCPLQQKNIAPIGKACPLETEILVQFMESYIEELGVDVDNLIELSMVRDLVDQEIQYLRKSKLLAQEDFIQENVVGIDSDGKPIMKKELHLAVDLEDKLHKRKKDLRNQLMATREARAKMGQSELDSAQVMAGVLDQVRDIQFSKERELQIKLGNLYKDDYIDDAEVVEEDNE